MSAAQPVTSAYTRQAHARDIQEILIRNIDTICATHGRATHGHGEGPIHFQHEPVGEHSGVGDGGKA